MDDTEKGFTKLFYAVLLKKILEAKEDGNRELSPEVEIIKDKLKESLKVSNE